jgi:two-component system sensor histidine kinase RegB
MAEVAAPAEDPNSAITLRNLIAARWVLLAIVLVAALLDSANAGPEALAGWLPSTEHPVATYALLAAWAGHNGLGLWLLRVGRGSLFVAGLHLLVDASALTIILVLAGGPQNPFTILYFLPITLATQVSPRWTWILAAWCLACFASLFFLAPIVPHTSAGEVAHEMPGHEMPSHEMGGQMPGGETPTHEMPQAEAEAPRVPDHFEGHLRGMWIAFGLAGALMTYFVHRIALDLAAQRAELERLRRVSLEDRHLAAIGSLAAGAAHELGTPLGTMTLLVDELPLMDTEERNDAVETVREQLDRCKLIVSRMASPELRIDTFGRDGAPWALGELEAALTRAPTQGIPIEISTQPGVDERRVQLPFEAVAQILRELIVNAAEACRRREDSSGVRVSISLAEDRLHVSIRDDGLGMDAATAAAAFDPFFSTRPEGQGMGLGLYLARAHLRQLGGSIELESEPDVGTEVRVALPLNTRLGPSPGSMA